MRQVCHLPVTRENSVIQENFVTPNGKGQAGDKPTQHPLFDGSSASGRWMLERQPGAVGIAAGDALLDEVHPLDAIVDVGVDRVVTLERLPGRSLHHVVVGETVDVGERQLHERVGQGGVPPAERTPRSVF